jgi:hypothetical protein
VHKTNKSKGPVQFVKVYFVEVVLTVSFIIFSSLIYGHVQKNQFCVLGRCEFWAGSWGFILVNISLGWMLCYYLFATIRGISLTKFLKLLLPLIIALYCLGISYFYGNYLLITKEKYIDRANLFEQEKTYDINNLDYIYKSGYSGDGINYYSIRLKNRKSISITNDAVIEYLVKKKGLNLK